MHRFVITSFAALRSRFTSRSGQSLAEYALILSFVSLSSVVLMTILGAQTQSISTLIMHVLQAIRAAI